MYTQDYRLLHPCMCVHSLQQPPPPSRCLPGCGGPTPHHLCGSTGTWSSSDCHQLDIEIATVHICAATLHSPCSAVRHLSSWHTELVIVRPTQSHAQLAHAHTIMIQQTRRDKTYPKQVLVKWKKLRTERLIYTDQPVYYNKTGIGRRL